MNLAMLLYYKQPSDINMFCLFLKALLKNSASSLSPCPPISTKAVQTKQQVQNVRYLNKTMYEDSPNTRAVGRCAMWVSLNKADVVVESSRQEIGREK